eukprot:11212344-Lingulodinium_polyedra.AAC.1
MDGHPAKKFRIMLAPVAKTRKRPSRVHGWAECFWTGRCMVLHPVARRVAMTSSSNGQQPQPMTADVTQ